MTIKTLATYLSGNREAILRIAASRRSLLLGLMFVLSAGFAREYDGEDLLHEPWHLLIPLGASLASSLVLYCLVACICYLRGRRNAFWTGYGTFLSLFWMTAPLAWLYAIPVEKLLSPADSVRANLCLLGIVATWRVVLITRVINVLYRCRWLAVFFVVMLFADAVLWIVLELTPMPIVSVMGGIRLTESEGVLLGTQFLLRVLGILSAPIWLFGTVTVLLRKSSEPLAWERISLDHHARSSIRPALWFLSGAALLVWVIVLPVTQPEQVNRWVVEKSLAENRLKESLKYMSARELSDFPPHWDPPPRIGYGEETPDLWKILRLTDDHEVAPWVRSIYVEKILAQSDASPYGERRIVDLAVMGTEELETYVQLLRDVGSGQRIAAAHKDEIEEIVVRASAPDRPKPLPERRRELLTEILLLGTDDEITESPEPVPAGDPTEP